MKSLAATIALVLVVAGAAGVAHAQKGRMGEVYNLQPGATPPVIELYTFGRGEIIFEKFGHTALCINYNEQGRETVCFNYGVTDFSMGGGALTWNFIRGKQKFFVEPIPLGGMIAFYRHEDRTIWRQALPLPAEQARAIEAKLLHDIKPENRFYIYDHFADNCTTRLRDIIDVAIGGRLREGSGEPFPLTFRQMGRRGLAELPPLIAFGDFAVGRALDEEISLWQAMFHPFVLRDHVEVVLDAPAELIYERRGPPIPEDGPTNRGWALVIGLAFALPLLASKLTGRFERTAVAIATVPLALIGLIIWTAAIISTIPGLRWNEAIFLYVPFDVVLPFLGAVRRRQYARVRLGMFVVGSLLTALGVFLQPLWVPIVIGYALFGLIAFELPNPPLAPRTPGGV
ncbi:MAG: DUF4105 domain-containing protein [Kofleriaceae bacterium]|nr:MAG: DUF4105 domain-containing protein [Kofleriaceae bacterium]MBZ0234027.1 DUF4105 domain-containing protein [Kofleriaceae bacterium]